MPVIDPGTYAFMTQSQRDALDTASKPAQVIPPAGATGPAPAPVMPAKPVGIISTQTAASDLQKSQSKLNNISPSSNPTAPPAPVTPATPVSSSISTPAGSGANSASAKPDYITLVNPSTGQTQTYNNPDINKQTIQGLMNSGWSVSESQLSSPFDFGTAGGMPGTPAKSQSQQDLDAANAAIDKTQAAYDAMKSTDDPQTAALITGITGKYDALKAAMADVNARQDASYGTLGYRIGGQYGAGGNSIKDLVSASSTAGLARIQSLQAQEDSEIANARIAEQNQHWTEFSATMNRLETVRAEKQTALNAENKALSDQLQKTQDAARLSSIQNAISGLLTQGVTDPKQILNYINNDQKGNATGANLTAKELGDTLDVLNSDPTLKAATDIAKTAAGNGAPADVLQKIASAKSLGEAYAAAGDYTQSGSGIVGEYQYYARQAKAAGQVPVDFSTYQNIDANRKAKASGNGNGDTVQSLAQMLVDGLLSPAELSKRATGNAPYNDILVAAGKLTGSNGKPFNIAQADRDYKFANRPQTQDTLNYLGSLVGSVDPANGTTSGGNMDDLVTLSNSIDRTSFPALNDLAAWGRYSSGDPKIAQFQAVATEVADQVAKILQGGSGGGGTSDAKLQQAVNLFNTNFTKDQLTAVISSLKPLLMNRAKNIVKDNAYLSDYADQFGISGKGGISTTSTIINQQANDPLNLGIQPTGAASTNPLGI